MRVTIIGCGYVGLSTSVALAYTGHRVHCIDQSKERINALQNGKVPIHEAGVAELLSELTGRLTFGDWSTFDEQADADVVIIAVGTPRKKNGDADLTYVEAVARELGERLPENKLPVIINKSTVPIGSARRVESLVAYYLSARGINNPVTVGSNPEFLREGVALFDTFYPDRIVVGVNDKQAANLLQEMYASILEQTFNPPEFLPRPEGYTKPALVVTTPTSAELIKYASNTFLAMKISFINEIAGLAEKVGEDIREVARGIGLDKRIGPYYLNAGIGWGGSCFGKDVQALIYTAKQYDLEMPLSCATIDVNKRQREEVVKKLQSALKVIRGSTIGLMGLAFKPGTDDLRDAPSIHIASRLIELGAHVKAYDPLAMENCRCMYPELAIEYMPTTISLFQDADALVLITEWEEFVMLPFSDLGKLMRRKIVVDGRNVLDRNMLEGNGFQYIGMGC